MPWKESKALDERKRWIELNRNVALKFLSPGKIRSAGTIDRFQREVQAASALNHPGIVTVHEVIRSDDELALVMEIVEGYSLRTLCSKANPVAQVANWGRQIAQVLAAAHAGGIVHRDIKPENLMLRPDGFVILPWPLCRRLRCTMAATSMFHRTAARFCTRSTIPTGARS